MSINTGPSPLGLQQELHTGLTTIRWALHFCRQLSQEKPYHLVETYTLPGEELSLAVCTFSRAGMMLPMA